MNPSPRTDCPGGLRRWWPHFVVTMMLVPSGIEVLNVYRALRFGWLLIALPHLSTTACTRSVIGQVVDQQRAGELFLALGVVSAAGLLSGRMAMRFGNSVLGVFLWYVYTSIRENCSPVPADALYEAQVIACAMTAFWTGYWLFSSQHEPVVRMLLDRASDRERG